ncbi:methyltransferase domain-containing protein [Erythrobacteraceae bacterium CFH 75059]|uniref:class I SAM-dependent methyltransferase n=1 Tax=Qipengyuania thermophila TaxID=2509361 RepID=UPI001020B453|nr:methyltransferase domain-containing protein [Qipengyuania thermophila]TCD06430.1 methyltransferase domain-containing protein [Erythrobacteraceae bacterium CFH 75059]
MTALYDSIGINYADLRRPDPRIASAIKEALSDCRSVVNVGAGTGSYEPTDRQVVAVEPSIDMIRKRAPNAAPAVKASAECLPFDDNSFDAAMAILTVHHWRDKPKGLRELRRVARGRVVLLTFDPASRPWLTDYLPELAALDEAQMPSLDEYEKYLGRVRVEPLMIPHDCSDGFLYAYWRRPYAYLDPRLRSGSSSFWALPDISKGIARLSDDLETGEWARRYANMLERKVYDAGYRLVVTDGDSGKYQDH